MAERLRVAKGIHLYRRPGSATWWADIVQAGRRARRSTGTQDETEARAIARQIAADADKVGRKPFSLDDAYLLWMGDGQRSETDVSALRTLRDRIPNRPAAALDDATVAECLAGMSPGAYNRVVNVLRASLRLAAGRGRIDRAPDLMKRPEPAGRVRFLSPEEWQRLRPQLPPHLLPAVEFSLATGLRRSNVLGLQWHQVDLRARMLHLPASQMKAGRPHSIPLGKVATKVLRAQRNLHELWVFPYRGKRIVSPKTAFGAALEAAGVEDFRWHDLRHTWASWMAMAGAPLHAIQQAGAWAGPDMVARYSHLTPSAIGDYQDAAVGKLKMAQRGGTKPRKTA